MNDEAACSLSKPRDFSAVKEVRLSPQPPLEDYLEAMRVATAEAESAIGSCMLVSWYDRDRDYESPQHSSECHLAGSVPGYVDYGLNHGARLKVDIEDGRFVFLYLPLDL